MPRQILYLNEAKGTDINYEYKFGRINSNYESDR